MPVTHAKPLPLESNRSGEDSPRRRRRAARAGVHGISCPRCLSEAVYRYGRTGRGNARFLCKVCGRQFSLGHTHRLPNMERPACPGCGKSMHIYMRAEQFIRFRCSDYPACRSFLTKRIVPHHAAHDTDQPS